MNLGWALNEIRDIYLGSGALTVQQITAEIKTRAIAIHEADRSACRRIGENGLSLLPEPCRVITHCNTGSLATGGWGTALGVIYAAVEQKRNVHVYVDETRPLGQGGRLTFWELRENDIPCTLITDSTAAFLMQRKQIDAIIFGADRIAANGDVANKIGSYALAVAAHYHHVPCYVAAPTSTFDLSRADGNQIPIEERAAKEILQIYGYDNNLFDVADVYNPAFDVTPAALISALITERGIIKQPYNKTINKLFKQI